MKDNDKVELTVKAVKRAAEKCGTAKEILKELFPEVFRGSPPEWEEMDLSEFHLDNDLGGGASLCETRVGDNPFSIILSQLDSGQSGKFKVEDGRLWRKKSA